MALELNTDGNATTSTTGETTDYKLGDTNTSTVGFVYGFTTFMFGLYFTFIRVVTGLTIDIQTPISISIFGGFRMVVQGGACFTVSKISETNVQNGLTKLIAELNENITSRNQIIETSTNSISTLNEAGTVRTIDYDTENTTGDTSTEEWSISKNITSGIYALDCKEGVDIGVNNAGLRVDTGGTYINGKIIELA